VNTITVHHAHVISFLVIMTGKIAKGIVCTVYSIIIWRLWLLIVFYVQLCNLYSLSHPLFLDSVI